MRLDSTHLFTLLSPCLLHSVLLRNQLRLLVQRSLSLLLRNQSPRSQRLPLLNPNPNPNPITLPPVPAGRTSSRNALRPIRKMLVKEFLGIPSKDMQKKSTRLTCPEPISLSSIVPLRVGQTAVSLYFPKARLARLNLPPRRHP